MVLLSAQDISSSVQPYVFFEWNYLQMQRIAAERIMASVTNGQSLRCAKSSLLWVCQVERNVMREISPATELNLSVATGLGS